MTQINPLSNREKEVVGQLLQGKSNKQIALALGISDRTVEFHLKNVYTKLQVSSRVELILHLRNTTGSPISGLLGYSTVESLEANAENRDRHNPQLNWAASFRKTVSTIGQEPEMKKRWGIYLLAGLIFGAGYWHYLSITARLFNNISSANNNTGGGLLFIIALLTYLGVWLIPAVLPALVEFHHSTSLRLSILAVITVFLSAVLGYYVNYLAMLAFFGLPNMEFLVIFGQRSAAFWPTWNKIITNLILYNYLKWSLVGILVGGIAGLITTSVYSSLSKKNYKISPV
jgi:DNA-binding CsgD family transcriptional regulator